MTDLLVDWLLLQLLLKVIVLCIKTIVVTWSILIYWQIFKCTYHVKYITIGMLIIQFCIVYFGESQRVCFYANHALSWLLSG